MSSLANILRRSVAEVAYEAPIILDKEASVGRFFEMVLDREADRAIITRGGIPYAVATARDLFRKLWGRHSRGISPESMAAANFCSDALVSIKPRDTLLTASNVMLENRFTAVPIIQDRKVFGFATLDTITSLLPKSHIKVESVALQAAYTISSSASLALALKKLEDPSVKDLVVTGNAAPVGFFGEKEAATALVRIYSNESIRHVEQALKQSMVDRFMRRTKASITPSGTLEDAYTAMRRLKVSSLPVIRDTGLVGVLLKYNVFSKLMGR